MRRYLKVEGCPPANRRLLVRHRASRHRASWRERNSVRVTWTPPVVLRGLLDDIAWNQAIMFGGDRQNRNLQSFSAGHVSWPLGFHQWS